MSSLLRVLQGQNEGVAGPLSGGSGEECTSSLIQVVGSFQFLAVIGLRSHFLAVCHLGSLSAPRSHSLVLVCDPSIFKASDGELNPSGASNLFDFPFCHQLAKILLLKGLND